MSNYSKTYRVGLVGSGGIARAHGTACQALDGADLTAICDVSQDALDRYGEQFGVPNRYLDLDDMLEDANLDIAILCNWGAVHAATGVQIAKSRQVRAILCEKPFTNNAAEARQMVAAAKENGILLAEAFKFRHHPMHLKAKELADSGAIGDVLTLRSTFCSGGSGAGPEARKPEDNWRFNKAKGGGSVYDLACYCIHHARFIFGADPARVFASSQPGLEVDDAMYILLVFPDDRTAQISVGFNTASAQYVEICGSGGMLRIEIAWNNENRSVDLEHRTSDGTELINFEPIHQFTNQLAHLCDCLETGQPHRIPPENSINQMRTIDAIFESAATGKAVEM